MGQKSRWTLPQTVHPDGYRTFTICVPDERFYIAAFEGLLIELTYSKNWQRDSAHTAAEVTRIWQDVLANAVCTEDCPIVIDEMDYEMSICEQLRFHNGKLQGFCCGEWVDITGQPPQGIDGPGQPGSGAEQPAAGGGCATYAGKFNASEQWLMPTLVNAGDTVSFSGIKGAGTDGTLRWYCPDGNVFFGGACGGGGAVSGGDPAPAINHMALLAKIGAVYYNITAGVITVPGGISNEQVIVQVNDSSLAGDGGDYSFNVTRCNNGVATTCQTAPFVLQDWGFTRPLDGGTAYGVYTLGAGWKSLGGANNRTVEIGLAFAAAYVTRIDVTYTANSGDVSGTSAQNIWADYGFATNLFNHALVLGSHLVYSWTGRQSMTGITIGLNGNFGTNADIIIESVTVYFEGTPPVTWQAC